MKYKDIEIKTDLEIPEEDLDNIVEQSLYHVKDTGEEIVSLTIEESAEYKDMYTVTINTNTDHKEFERVRRITGYLSSTNRWNNAKKAELADRVGHVE